MQCLQKNQKKENVNSTYKKMKMKAETVRGIQSKFVNATFTNIQKKGSNANSL